MSFANATSLERMGQLGKILFSCWTLEIDKSINQSINQTIVYLRHNHINSRKKTQNTHLSKTYTMQPRGAGTIFHSFSSSLSLHSPSSLLSLPSFLFQSRLLIVRPTLPFPYFPSHPLPFLPSPISSLLLSLSSRPLKSS